jgi:hypothetical protein
VEKQNMKKFIDPNIWEYHEKNDGFESPGEIQPQSDELKFTRLLSLTIYMS